MAERYVSPLRVERVRCGLTQEELARKVHRSPTVIVMLETEGRLPRLDLARAIARVLGQPIDVLWPPPASKRRGAAASSQDGAAA